MSNYILNITHNLNIDSILYLSANNKPDYLNNLSLHGFKKILGKKCYDHPKISCIYHNGDVKTKTTTLFTLQNILEHKEHEEIENIENNIKNNKYSLIIYGSYTRGMPYFDLVTQFYNSENIILLNGEDSVPKNIDEKIKKYSIFFRELI